VGKKMRRKQKTGEDSRERKSRQAELGGYVTSGLSDDGS
jgi:hypothetical protein